jgi:uncharacterized protein
MEIKGAHVMITGSNRGIGRAFAKSCAEDKAHLHLVVRKKDATLVKEMEEAGAASVTLWAADLSSPNSIAKLIEATAEVKVDILFNNAGVLTGGLLEKQSEEEIYNVFQVNVIALVQLTRAFLPGMLRRKYGKIINNASVSAIMHIPGATTYSASKAAVFAFTECLKNELHGTKVTTLNLVTPSIKTGMYDEIAEKYGENFDDTPGDALSPQIYVKMIREAVLNDLPMLEPQGMTGIGLKIAKYIPQVFDWGARRKFKR